MAGSATKASSAGDAALVLRRTHFPSRGLTRLATTQPRLPTDARPCKREHSRPDSRHSTQAARRGSACAKRRGASTMASTRSTASTRVRAERVDDLCRAWVIDLPLPEGALQCGCDAAGPASERLPDLPARCAASGRCRSSQCSRQQRDRQPGDTRFCQQSRGGSLQNTEKAGLKRRVEHVIAVADTVRQLRERINLGVRKA